RRSLKCRPKCNAPSRRRARARRANSPCAFTSTTETEEGTMSWLDRIESEIQGWFTSPDALRTISAELRSLAPIASVAGWTIVSRYDDVREVLANDRAFGVTEIYAARMDRTTGTFFLGMENTPQYQREAAIARAAVR